MARVYRTPRGPQEEPAAAADCELDEIVQVAAELGFTGGEVAAFRRRQLGA